MDSALSVVGDQLWKRIGESMDRVELRLRKMIAILERTGIPFAIVGGNAVRILVAHRGVYTSCSNCDEDQSQARPTAQRSRSRVGQVRGVLCR